MKKCTQAERKNHVHIGSESYLSRPLVTQASESVLSQSYCFLEHLHPCNGNKAYKSSFEGQCFLCWACAMEPVPLSLGEFASSSMVGCSMRDLGLETDISDEYGGTWHYGMGHERKGT